MRRVRWFVLSVAGGLLLAIVGGVFGEFFIEWARESEWYANPSKRVDAFVDAFISFVGQPGFISVATFCAGLAVGMWLDVLLRRRDQQPSLSTQTATLAAQSVDRGHLSFERGPEFIHHRAGEECKPWITFRIRLSATIVNKTNPYLLAVRRYEHGEWSQDKLAAARPLLSWIGSGNRFVPRAVHGEEYILLLDYDMKEGGLSFVVDKKKIPFSIREFVNNIPHGKYLLDVGVPSDAGRMLKGTFVLDWFGDSESISLLPAP